MIHLYMRYSNKKYFVMVLLNYSEAGLFVYFYFFIDTSVNIYHKVLVCSRFLYINIGLLINE